jgi:hypothetical protein
MDAIEKGTEIQVVDALGHRRAKRVLAEVHGGSYPAVWACSDDEWKAAQLDGRDPEPEPFPWPVRVGAPTMQA